MNNRVWRALAIAVLVIAGAAIVGINAYNAGVAHAIAESGRAIAPPPPAGAPYAYGYYGWPRPWGFGFFPFFPIFPIFALLFFFIILRGLLWRGPWHRGGWGCGYDGLDEWHRRAHGEQPPSRPTPGSAT